MITREQLYQLVWSKPMIKVAEQFEVSGSYMARICSILRVPRPERGYWAKLEVGKAPAPRPLPEAQPGDPVSWSKDGELPAPPRPKPAVPPKPTIPIPRLARPATGIHPLINGAKTHFESGRPIKDDEEYLKPFKKILADVTTSKTGLDKALTFANTLFNALETAGHRVTFSPQSEQWHRANIDRHEQPIKGHDFISLWSPQRPTVVFIGTVAIGLAIVEMSEEVLMRYVNGKYIRDADYMHPKSSRRSIDHTWTTHKQLPSGRLRLKAYSPYPRVDWSTHWQETKTVALTQSLASIVKTIEKSAVDLIEKIKEADRKAEIAYQARLAEEERWRQEENRRKIQQSIKESRAHLSEIIQAWSDVMNIERFFQSVHDRAHDLPDAERSTLHERLKLAHEFVGTQNPLDFFMAWKTPVERYRPLPVPAAPSEDKNTGEHSDEDEHDGEAADH